MPHFFLMDFFIILSFVFILSALTLLFTTRSPSAGKPGFDPIRNDADDVADPAISDNLSGKITHDEEPPPKPRTKVPHIDLPGTRLGGGASEELCSRETGTISLVLNEPENERRKYNRRLRDRRQSDFSVQKDNRLMQRRVWLRREEDHRGKNLLSVQEAADILETTTEQIYKWLGNSDIPFYQISEGKRKVIRLEINELLQWHSTCNTSNDATQAVNEEDD